MKSTFAKRLLSLTLCLAMLIAMFSMLASISAFAAQTTIIDALDPADWNYTTEEGKFYFDSPSEGSYYLYSTAATGANGKSIVTKDNLNLGTDFTATFKFGAKTASSNYPSNTILPSLQLTDSKFHSKFSLRSSIC